MYSFLKTLTNAYKNVFEVSLRSLSSAKTHKSFVLKRIKNFEEKKQNSFDAKVLKKEIIGDVLYGIHPVRMALMAKRRIFNHLYVNENILESKKSEIVDILDMAKELSIPLTIQKNFILNLLSEDRPHQGFCLDASKLTHQSITSDLILNERRMVILDSIQDPQNFGSILRSCYYFGFTKVLTSNRNSCGLTSTVSKASSGALELIDIYSVPDLVEFSTENFLNDWLLIGTVASNGSTYLKLEDAYKITDKKIAIVFGNEERGISESLGALCHKHVTIPATYHPNLVGSLNVSVATGIILHALKISNVD